MITGKWWGSRDKQPIICLHGWQDNANSFNNLIPLLPSEFSYLALDLPGHGLSSHIPKGFYYKIFTLDPLLIIRRIQSNFKWEKLSFIGHSLGAASSVLYSSVFSEDVNFFVAIDSIKPLYGSIQNEIKYGPKSLEELLKYDFMDITTATEYKEDELVKIWLQGTKNSITEETCRILLQRGASGKDGRLKLRRDPRLKRSLFAKFSKKLMLRIAQNVSCNVLYIKAADWPYFENEKDVVEMVEIIKKKAKYFEEHKLPGGHHLHLNNPEPAALVISAFIKFVTKEKE